MAKQFDNDEVAVLRRIINEYEYGLPTPGEMFGNRQKPLTYSELAAVRRMILAQTAVDAGKQAAKYASGLLDTVLPPRPRTSTLLTDAANLISDVAHAISAYPQLMGKDWGLVVTQLRQRATTLQKLDQ
jgi:hypothetical protein